jgi:acetylglutamate/LysW-gamma-L-alpha-aminoadipate kinase
MIGVVKIGGAPGNDSRPLLEDLAGRVARGERWVLVHGASGVMDQLCEDCGFEPRYVTSPTGYRSRYVGRAERALFEGAALSFSARLASALADFGLSAVPLRPDCVATALAERKDVLRSVENGRRRILRGNYSGTVCDVQTASLNRVWQAGGIPLLPPLGLDPQSGLNLNIDGDRLAAATGIALGAGVVVILSNVAGLLRDPHDGESLVEEGFLQGWDELEPLAEGNMKRKLLACREALEGGVPRVVIGDSRTDSPLSRVIDGEGTQLWREGGRSCRRSMAIAG